MSGPLQMRGPAALAGNLTLLVLRPSTQTHGYLCECRSRFPSLCLCVRRWTRFPCATHPTHRNVHCPTNRAMGALVTRGVPVRLRLGMNRIRRARWTGGAARKVKSTLRLTRKQTAGMARSTDRTTVVSTTRPGAPTGITARRGYHGLHEHPAHRALHQAEKGSPRAGVAPLAGTAGTADLRERVGAGLEAVGGATEDDPQRIPADAVAEGSAGTDRAAPRGVLLRRERGDASRVTSRRRSSPPRLAV